MSYLETGAHSPEPFKEGKGPPEVIGKPLESTLAPSRRPLSIKKRLPGKPSCLFLEGCSVISLGILFYFYYNITIRNQ